MTYVINPQTGRKVKVGGRTYNQMIVNKSNKTGTRAMTRMTSARRARALKTMKRSTKRSPTRRGRSPTRKTTRKSPIRRMNSPRRMSSPRKTKSSRRINRSRSLSRSLSRSRSRSNSLNRARRSLYPNMNRLSPMYRRQDTIYPYQSSFLL